MSRILFTVKGHNLVADGAAFNEDGTRLGSGAAGTGRAHCECGWVSDILGSQGKRRDAHRAHKTDIQKMDDLREKHGLTEDTDTEAEHASVEAIEAALTAGEAEATEAEDLIGAEPPVEAPKATRKGKGRAKAPQVGEAIDAASTITPGDVVNGFVVAAVRLGRKRVVAVDEDLKVVVYARPDEAVSFTRAEDAVWPAPGTEVKTIKGSILKVGDYVRKGGQPVRVAALWTDGRLVKAQGSSLEMLFNGAGTGTVEVFN